MNPPSNTSLPFFAYGIFKPGQLCFSRIRDLVEQTIEGSVGGILRERDGIPLLITGDYSRIKGHLLYFHSGKEDEAYCRIIAIEPDKVYRWGQIQANERVAANSLLGIRALRGSSDLEHLEEWDGRSDPFFKQGLEEVEAILRDNADFDSEFRSLLRLQMAYTLLWSAIERYAGLKYHLGKRATNKVYQIAEEKCFADSLRRNVKGEREVISATDLRRHTLDPNDPGRSIRYYYQVRSNTIHRGKAVIHDFDTVKWSLEELLAIFRDILSEAFKE